MKSMKHAGIAVPAMAGAFLLIGIVSPPASADNPGQICATPLPKPEQCGGIGQKAKFAADRCNLPINEVLAIAREVEETGESRLICVTGDLVRVEVRLSDDE